jgi:hypothetical protein
MGAEEVTGARFAAVDAWFRDKRLLGRNLIAV